MFSGDIKRDQWHEMGLKKSQKTEKLHQKTAKDEFKKKNQKTKNPEWVFDRKSVSVFMTLLK